MCADEFCWQRYLKYAASALMKACSWKAG